MPETRPEYLDVLADRYATPEMVGIWAPEGKVQLERELWIAVMQAQGELGVSAISSEAIDDYRAVVGEVNLASIREREMVTKHDVKARIEEFDALAGHQLAHLGMTSRDLTENIEQLQVYRSLELVRNHGVAVVLNMAARAMRHSNVAVVGRSHNVPAQTTTLGKRFATVGEETMLGLDRIQSLMDNYPLRGIKGPVGTQQDMLDLFKGDADKVKELEERVAGHLGFSSVFNSVGQVYPRSLDLQVVDSLLEYASGPANMAKLVRLMAGQDLASEGFAKGQTGSSAMPHKMNARTSERINGFKALLAGNVAAAAQIAGDQWNEGDVSESVTRRIILPNAFFTVDGINEAALTVLEGFGVFKGAVDAELEKQLQLVSTTKILIALTEAGIGREDAHEIIKEHSTALVNQRRETGSEGESLYARLAQDERVPLTQAELRGSVDDPIELTGMARQQVRDFVARADELARKHPEAARYTPQPIL